MPSPERVCFVTVGATATFDALIEAVLSKPFVTELLETDFTHLIVQYGKDNLPLFDRLRLQIPADIRSKLKICGFDFKTEGLTDDMIRTRKMFDRRNTTVLKREEGLVVSHAGTIGHP
jgi:beta-1,4-N-acetylglucosaminyltransferase